MGQIITDEQQELRSSRQASLDEIRLNLDALSDENLANFAEAVSACAAHDRKNGQVG